MDSDAHPTIAVRFGLATDRMRLDGADCAFDELAHLGNELVDRPLNGQTRRHGQ